MALQSAASAVPSLGYGGGSLGGDGTVGGSCGGKGGVCGGGEGGKGSAEAIRSVASMPCRASAMVSGLRQWKTPLGWLSVRVNVRFVTSRRCGWMEGMVVLAKREPSKVLRVRTYQGTGGLNAVLGVIL